MSRSAFHGPGRRISRRKSVSILVLVNEPFGVTRRGLVRQPGDVVSILVLVNEPFGV